MQPKFVHEMFCELAYQQPDLTAIDSVQGTLSYRELNRRSNAISSALVSAGVRKGDLVVIFAENRIFIIECILAVLKTGAAFVPLTPDLPGKRLESMLAQCEPRWVIVEDENRAQWEQVPGHDRVSEVAVQNANGDQEFAAEAAEPDGLSYIFFTSGSAGQPKPIAGRLKAIDHFISWELRTFALTRGTRVSQLISPVFDAVLRDIFAPLCAGGTICIPPDQEMVMDGAALGRWLMKEKINLVHVVPSLFRMVLNQRDRNVRFDSLKYVLLSGEKLLPADVKKWHALGGDGKLVNLYGPSETTMTKFVYFIGPDDQFKRSVPIGKPIDGAKALIVDENQRACPKGTVGEIYIRTPYRSLGYYRQPALTNAVFIPNPFSQDPSDVVYKTGDLARMLEDGNFELIGRRDHQVKIRGVRIELGEIEAALAECKSVEQAVVVDREDVEGNKVLCAYVVPRGTIEASELRQQLAMRLPEYMLPSAYVMLSEFARTPTGKIDREALTRTELKSRREYIAPRTPVEEMLAQVWSHVLRLEKVGIRDNFFELGGHSLLATKLTTRVRKAFQAEVPLRWLLENGTVEAMAQAIQGQRWGIRQGSEAAMLKRCDESERNQLSYAQRRLWFLHQLEPASSAYNLSSGVKLRGPLDVTALELSLNEIIRRHETLRTTFVAGPGGEPELVIAPELRIALPVRLVTGGNEQEQQEQLRRIMRAEIAQPFDLSSGPLIRAQLLALSEHEHVALLTVHHIVSDAWSQAVLVDELAKFYIAHSKGERPAMEELPIQYADYAAWQREGSQDGLMEKQLAYWLMKLHGTTGVLDLPTDYVRPAAQSQRGASFHAAMSEDLGRALQQLAWQETSTLFMVLLASLQVLFWRYSGQQDFCLGTPISNRGRQETEHLIGLFLNTLVMRTELQPRMTFQALLNSVREAALEAYAHQDIPFEKLVDELEPERDLSRSPLFQVMFAFQNVPEQSLQLPGLEVEVLLPDLETSKFDLSVIINAEHGRLNTTFEYSTALFEQQTIERLWKHWQNLLQEIVAHPEIGLTDLRLLDTAERRQILYDWNQTTRRYPQGNTVLELFEQRAMTAPSAAALIFENQTLTYAELNRYANQVARFLGAKGAGPEQVIGICMERSIEMVVSLLGVLKAGAAYVPLDPGLPAERLEYMIANAQAGMVLAQGQLLQLLPARDAELIPVDREWPQIGLHADANVETRAAGENLAYVIYTSGSTGWPKGAMNEHHAIRNRLMWMQDAYQLTSGDRVLQKTPYSFDVSVWEFLWPLLAGARLVVARPGGHQDSAYLVKLIREQGITTIHFVPSMLQAFIEEPGVEKCVSLKRVICSGEALGWELQEAFHRRLPWAELHNLYGPTEAAVDVTFWHCERGSQRPGVVPLGRPIANTQLHILDEDLEPVPVGVTGEIHIAGEAVGRGYWNNPDLTAQKFVPNPFSDRAGQRLYKTGDLGKYRADGVIEYLGRNDSQVKLRGFRIELGEIETALRRHLCVRQATVVVRVDLPGQQRLVAYVVPQQAAAISSPKDEFEAFLRGQLPEYMIPSSFVLLEQLPLTSSGKIDRRALPKPELRVDKQRVAPRTSTEEGLAAIWAEVLGLDEVGIDDNFFNVGGDSIRSIQVRARAQQAGWNFSLQDMFRYQTIRQLAEHMGEEEAEPIPDTAPFSLITDEDRQKLPDDMVDAYPLAMLQMGMLFHQEFAPERAMYHNTLSFHVRAPWDHAKFELAVNAVVQRHPALRTSFDLDGYSVPLQLVHRAAFLPVPEGDLRGMSPGQQEEFVTSLVEREKLRPFDLARPPQISFQVHRRSDDTFQFTLTENHAMFDGWSLNSILAEVLEHYFALLKEQEPPVVPEPKSKYRDFVYLERQAIKSEQHRNFWLEKLKDVQATTLDAFTAGRTSVQEAEIRFRPVLFPLQLSQRLQSVARALGVHVKSVLLAAHQKVLSLITGNTDVVTGMVSHGRIGQVDGERVKGLFLNTLPLRLTIGQGTWKDLIEKTFAAQQELFPYRRYPLHLIKQDLGDLPFDCLFDFVHFHVLDKMVGSGEMEVLGVTKYEATSFKLFANFHQTVTTPEIELSIGYDSGVFSEKQIQIIEGYYRKVINAIASDLLAFADDELLLENKEQRLAIASWNWNPPQHRGPSVHQLFEQQVARAPEALAVDSDGLKLSYRELDHQANVVAHELASAGAAKGDAIIIFTENRVEMIAAVIGTLKAGCAFVPMLPQLPDKRLQALLEASAPNFAIVPEQLSPRMQELATTSGRTIRLVSAERIRDRAAQAHQLQAPIPHSTANDLGYIFFTSGSTGTPKAIAGRKGAIDQFIRWEIESFGIGPGTRVSQLISPMFDAMMRDIFVPLCAGGTICLPLDQQAGVDAGALGRWLAEQQINLVHLVPSLFRLMLNQLDQQTRLDCLRHVLLSGERLLPSDVSNWYGRGERGQLVNLYGPSETTMTKFCYLVSPEDASKRSIPVGRPIDGAAALILNNAGRMCIPGSAGEICIRTPYRSHGYHLRPDLTAESFVPNPYGKDPDDLIYRTGDIGRVLDDGDYELIGRKDQQIKVHGIRIEPGEIEAVLTSCECVSQAAVVDRQDSEGNTYLCAYLVPAGSLDLNEIRRQAALQLPEYMFPGMYVQIDRLPLLANGKLDRSALPSPESATVVKRHTYVEPRNVVEQVIAAMWQEILQVERVGVLDNFFELGGHSLLITQLISRTRAVFRIEIPLRNFFDLEQATVENFARLVVSRERRPGEVEQIASVMSKISELSESELEEAVRGQGEAS